MCSEPLIKEFEKATQVLPFTKYGLSTYNEFKNVANEMEQLEWLKKVGLTDDEIKLYKEKDGIEGGKLKIDSNIRKNKLDAIHEKIKKYQCDTVSTKQSDEQPCASTSQNTFQNLEKGPVKYYPPGHPMNDIKLLEDTLFKHLKSDDILPITKRRKILRRLERRKQRLEQGSQIPTHSVQAMAPTKRGSLWDVKEIPTKMKDNKGGNKPTIGPKVQTMYTIKDNKIVRLEPVIRNERLIENEYQAVDIVVPVNEAEQQLLEGTKMTVDDIKKIERFKDYEPGIPSKVLYLKNIAPSISQEQLTLLFNQFVLENGGPVDIRLMTGRMRGQAFVSFHKEDLAITALEEINGTILSGRPIIAEFGRNTNSIQNNENS